MILETVYRLYLEFKVANGHAPKSIETVKTRVGRFVHGRETVEITSITKADIHAHFERLRDVDGLAIGTLAGHKSTNRAFWNWCLAQGYIESDPSIVLKQRRVHQYSYEPINHVPAPRDDFDRVMAALDAYAARRNYEPSDVRNVVFFSLVADSTCRCGELHMLRVKDIKRALERPKQGNGYTVYHAIAGGKTGAAKVRFFESTAEWLRLWLDIMPSNAHHLFCNTRTGRKLRADYLSSTFVNICNFAGVPPFRPHSVRKLNVTDAIEETGDLKVGQELAGHKDIRTTAKHYNFVTQTRIDAIAAGQSARRRKRRPTIADEFFIRRKKLGE